VTGRDFRGDWEFYLRVANGMEYRELDSRENLQAKTPTDMLIEYRYK
jgi:hypothetical protein